MARGGGFPGMGGNMQQLARQAQKLQQQMQKTQEELDAREYEASAGGGMVSVKINGKKEVLAITIKPEAVDPDDVEMLQDMIMGRGQRGHASGRRDRGARNGPAHRRHEPGRPLLSHEHER